MPVIVRHLENGREYVLLGPAVGGPSGPATAALGSWPDSPFERQHALVALVDAAGKIWWAEAEEVVVVRVGDRAPGDWLRGGGAPAGEA